VLKRGIIKERVNYYITSGLRDRNEIVKRIQNEFPEESVKSSSIKSYISIIGFPKEKIKIENQSTESKNNNSNDSNVSGNNDNVSPRITNSSANTSDLSTSANVEGSLTQQEETQESEIETNQEGFPKTEQEQNSNLENKSPLGLIQASKKFELNSSEAKELPESQEIARSYAEQPIPETIDPEQEKKTQVHIDRFGEIAGDISEMLFKSPTFYRMSRGYKIEQKEVNRINEDMSIVIKQRCPVVFSEYGDLVNLGGDFLRIGLKGIAHRLKTPMSDEFKKRAEISEENAKQVVQEVVNEIKKESQEIKEPEITAQSEIEDNVLKCVDCGNTSEQDLDNGGRCPNCHFNHTINSFEDSNR